MVSDCEWPTVRGKKWWSRRNDVGWPDWIRPDGQMGACASRAGSSDIWGCIGLRPLQTFKL